jgi:hypothetical protein
MITSRSYRAYRPKAPIDPVSSRNSKPPPLGGGRSLCLQLMHAIVRLFSGWTGTMFRGQFGWHFFIERHALGFQEFDQPAVAPALWRKRSTEIVKKRAPSPATAK